MAYTKTQWQDHVTTYNNRYTETENADGSINLTKVQGEVIQQGTPMSAENFNKLEAGVETAHETLDAHIVNTDVHITSDEKEAIEKNTTDLASHTGNSNIHLTSEQHVDLIDGTDTTLHFHSADRDRENHSGKQLSSTISDFAASVRTTVLTGLSTVTNAVIDATDTVISALGKFQKQITDHKSDYTLQVPYAGVTTGSANTYAITAPTITALSAGMAVSVKFNFDSTAASTLNWCGLGAKLIKKANGADVTNLKAAGIYTLRYDGTNFILQGEGASGNAAASDLLSGKTASVDAGEITGTMPNKVNAGIIITPGTIDQAIAQGYYDGAATDGKVLGDADLIPSNIRKDTNIFGVVGNKLEYGTGDKVPANRLGLGSLYLKPVMGSPVNQTYYRIAFVDETNDLIYVVAGGFFYKVRLSTGVVIGGYNEGLTNYESKTLYDNVNKVMYIIMNSSGTDYLARVVLSNMSGTYTTINGSYWVKEMYTDGTYLYLIVSYGQSLSWWKYNSAFTLVSSTNLGGVGAYNNCVMSKNSIYAYATRSGISTMRINMLTGGYDLILPNTVEYFDTTGDGYMISVYGIAPITVKKYSPGSNNVIWATTLPTAFTQGGPPTIFTIGSYLYVSSKGGCIVKMNASTGECVGINNYTSWNGVINAINGVTDIQVKTGSNVIYGILYQGSYLIFKLVESLDLSN
ncbi:hypothetical protein [Acetobacterium tundrae]|uniref:Uncharacterized protein n=1 Tax=Acetobacterium tundrae TaxID=132932 RepID=A0ABR6WP04_9FIRM|nr:hypothetical protein [Acetobacterium tundrae]MBC3798013.1 hypothetical protein [Acetobacterium tundrae]